MSKLTFCTKTVQQNSNPFSYQVQNKARPHVHLTIILNFNLREAQVTSSAQHPFRNLSLKATDK